MTKAREMLELADEFEGEANAHRAMGDKAEATKCLRAAYALRLAAQADAPAIEPQRMRDRDKQAIIKVLREHLKVGGHDAWEGHYYFVDGIEAAAAALTRPECGKETR